jgi:hypothetical protein
MIRLHKFFADNPPPALRRQQLAVSASFVKLLSGLGGLCKGVFVYQQQGPIEKWNYGF